MTRITTVGDRQIDHALKEFLPRLQKKYIRKALRTSAKIVSEGEEGLVPEDTGLLAGTIRIKARPRSRLRLAIDIIIGSDVIDDDSPYYALFVEFGHITQSGELIEAQPFARPALWDNADKIQRLFLRTLRTGLRELARQLYPKRRFI